MEISADSFHNLLRRISEAVSVKESSTVLHQNMLQKTFEQRAPYDEKLAAPGKISVNNLLPEKAFGRDGEKEMLLSRLMNNLDSKRIQLSVITILGASGIGKTTLARLVYEDKAVKERFELRAWVKVEGQRLNLQHAAHGILQSALGMSCSIYDLEELGEMMRDTLHSQRCLIVFDGIESMDLDSWRHMKQHWFGSLDLGSMALLTTSNKDVAANLPLLEVSPLSWDDSLSLCGFQLEYEDDSTEGIKSISLTMAKNLSALCQGNPLALKLVGSMMRHDEKIREILHSVDFSDVILLDVSVPVLVCIWVLPLHLRQCLAFCAVFPKGYALSKEKIIDMWIAHGLVNPSSESEDDSLEDIGNIYFQQLLCRSFFTAITCNEYGNITEFRMASLIYENLLVLARILWNGKVRTTCSVGADASQLSLSFPFTYSKHVQSLILSAVTYSGDCSLDHSLRDFKDLRSLDLSCSNISSLSDDICALKELRYLNLSYTLVETLPDSITNLSQLQTLDLSGCYHLNVLPKGMSTLIHTRRLDLSRCDSLSYLPSGIGFLKSLTSMPLFVLGKDHDSAGLGDLGPLIKLRGSLEIRNLENATRISEAQGAKLHDKNLHHLELSWSQNADNCFEILELLEPNIQLQDLDVTGYSGSRFPQWISSINGLMKISITDCGSKELPSLGQLPVLKELQLKGMTNLARIGPEFYGDASTDVFFPSLQQFGLYDLPKLSEWLGETSPNSSGISFQCLFQSLKTVTIEACPKLTSLPPLPTLSNMIVRASNEEILSSLASFTSLSSLLINDMELGVSNFQDLTWLDSLKKLILCNVKDKLIVNISHVGTTFTALQHLSILHCHQLTDLCLFYFSSLQKLHVVDCPNLYRILVREEKETPLVELVIEDCPDVFSEICFSKFPSLRKLIGKNCGGDFTTYYAGEYKKLEKLEYLFISGCSRVELELQAFPSLISHVPCIIVGDHKVNYEGMKDLIEIEVPVRASYESKAEDLLNQRSHTQGGSGRSQRCFGALRRGERRGSFSFLTTVRRTTCFETHVMMPA